MSKRITLTERQQEIYDFVAMEILEHGLPPTIREVADHFKMSSSNGAREVLNVLIHKGYLRRREKVSRGIELVEPLALSPGLRPSRDVGSDLSSDAGDNPTGRAVPLLAADSADMAEALANADGTVVIDGSLAEPDETVFATRVADESMRPSGFREGDLIVVVAGQPREDECFVVAGVSGSLVVRRCIRRRDGYSLHADRAVPTDRSLSSSLTIPADGGGPARLLGTIRGLVRTFRS